MTLRLDSTGGHVRNILFSLDRDGYEICVRNGVMVGSIERGNHMQGETWEGFRRRVLAAVQALAEKYDVEPERIFEEGKCWPKIG